MKTEHLAVSVLTLAVQGALVAMFAVPLSAAGAEDETDVATLTQPTNTVEIGVENVSQKSAKFGEYNGLEKSGADLIGNFNVRGGDAYRSFEGGNGVNRWEVKGTDLGTTSRELSGTVSNQGQWNLGVSYDQLRHHITDTYQTPYQGAMGGNNFSLPASFGAIDVDTLGGPVPGTGTQALTPGQVASFRTVSVYTDRKNTSFNAGYNFDRQWSVQFDYNRLDQSGAKLIGSGTDARPPGQGFEDAITLMNPTNYKTDTFDLSLQWVGDKGHLTASYFASIFKDGYDSVSWANPFWNSAIGGTVAPPPYLMNVFATPPSSNFHQLNLSGGYDFTSATRLAGGLSYGRNTQNSSFINDPLMLSALPQASLNGLVVTTHADLKLTTQTTKELALSAGLKYDERDNRTPSNTYETFGTIGGDIVGAAVNTPMSNKKTQLE
jgi:MtrB/PioB family decaheme-associated outer membrane protein